MNVKTLEFECPQCGANTRNHYRDVDYVEYTHDKRFLELGILLCGNCENGAATLADVYAAANTSDTIPDCPGCPEPF